MANINAPRGFSPMYSAMAASGNQQARLYFIPSTDGSAYYIGDTVKSAATGDANGVPGVQKCVSGDAPRGVIVGVRVADSSTSLQGVSLSLETLSIPASKTRGYYVYVEDDPQALFEIQDDGLTALTATSMNKNASYTVAAPTQGPLSATVLTTSSVATTSTLTLKIMGIKQSDDNALGLNARYIVKFNQHELLGNTAGV